MLYTETEALWPLDRKILSGNMDVVFSYGINNPVPASIVDIFSNSELHLTDGITRILYLLLNKAEAFPIMCPNKYVNDLLAIAGIENF